MIEVDIVQTEDWTAVYLDRKLKLVSPQVTLKDFYNLLVKDKSYDTRSEIANYVDETAIDSEINNLYNESGVFPDNFRDLIDKIGCVICLT